MLTKTYDSPVGPLTMKIQDGYLIALDFSVDEEVAPGADAAPADLTDASAPADLAVWSRVAAWLDAYFAGDAPSSAALPIDFEKCPGYTPFRGAVWELLRAIPRGQTVTYGYLAAQIAKGQNRGKSEGEGRGSMYARDSEELAPKSSAMLSRAVGQAVGHNPIPIIVPCHRVVGADGSLTGFMLGKTPAGWESGVALKKALLERERR